MAPKSPIALDLETPQYKRYEVNLGLPDMPQIIVRTEKRGDAMIIEVRPKPGTGPERALAVLPSPKSQGTEPEMVSTSQGLPHAHEQWSTCGGWFWGK